MIIKKDGILFIDKPTGITSFDVIRILRKKLGIHKMGHSGTLDPLATGLLIVGIGNGTKKLKEYLTLPKVYEAEILLGIKTDTADIDGNILEEMEVPKFTKKELNQAVLDVKGKTAIRAPMYSAIKVGGKPLYKYARRKEKPPFVPKKDMQVFWIKLKGVKRREEQVVLSVGLEVASGTYIRSIAEEIGKKLGVPAAIQKLRRTKIGTFNVKNAEKGIL